LPVILLFLPYRKKYYPFLIILFLILELLVFIKTDNKVINSNDISKISQESKDRFFSYNRDIFKDKSNNDDIYDINIFNYVDKAEVTSLVTKENSFDVVMNRVREAFYDELVSKVLDEKL
jgi:hypothetical protein